LVVVLGREDECREPEVRENEVQRSVVEFVVAKDGEDEGRKPEAEDNSGLHGISGRSYRNWEGKAYDTHFENEMLVVRVLVEEVASDADDDGRAEPCHGVATGNGKARDFGGNDLRSHCGFLEDVMGSG
jgi:hypothetical protein